MQQEFAPVWLTTFLLLSACGKDDDTSPPDDTGSPPVDADGDGYPAGEDCDDGSAAVHPGADEVCNGLDDDCDGTTDEDDAVDAATWYTDADGDGYGDPTRPVGACAAPKGTVVDATDCDDADATIHPGALDLPCTGVAEDCVADTGDLWVPTDQPSLQAAIDAAPDDAWICVAAGTYAPFTMEHPVRLAALEGPDATTIDGADAASLGLIDGADGALVRGFSFANGAQTVRPAGLLVSGSDGVTLQDNRFEGLDGGTFCGGLVVYGCEDTRIEGNTFEGNEGQTGAALALYLTGDAVLVDNEFTDNEAEAGPALLLLGAGAVTVEGGSFSGNVASDAGGAIAVNTAESLSIDGATFVGNVALGDGGHLWASALDTLEISGSSLSGGSAGGDGGSLWVEGASFVDLDTNTISEGNAAGMAGGAVLLDTGVLALVRTTWRAHQGDGVTTLYVRIADGFSDVEGVFDATGSSVDGYQVLVANEAGAPMTLEGTRWVGDAQRGAIAAWLVGPASVSMSEVAVEGGAGFALDQVLGEVDIDGFQGTGLGSGGLSIAGAGEVRIARASLSAGLAGLAVRSVGGDVRLTGLAATDNAGAGLTVSHVTGTVRVEDPTVTGNLFHGIYLEDAEAVLLTDPVLQGNRVTGPRGGGGLYATDIASLVLSGGDVSGNTSAQPGGGLCVDTSYLALSDPAVVHDNSPDQVACHASSGCTAY
jgi:predicted outer membrane repeat protein